MFPGIGQVYNGQVAKAFTYLFAFVASIYATAEIAALPFAFLIPFTYFFNLIDAFRSASQINLRAQGGRLEPEEIAPLAVYLASDEARMVTGQAFNICGGLVMS